METFQATTTATLHSGAGPVATRGPGQEKQRARNAVSSTAKRVAEAEALLRKRKAKLREEQELTVLRRLAAERLGGGWSAKNRNAIFDALITAYDL